MGDTRWGKSLPVAGAKHKPETNGNLVCHDAEIGLRTFTDREVGAFDWAPFWEPFEDRHFEISAVGRILPFVTSPVLVVGAGQGILVEYLGRYGHEVVGLDASKAMAIQARRRRGLKCVLADARRLPFEEARFGTVLIATGVLDYQSESDAAHAML